MKKLKTLTSGCIKSRICSSDRVGFQSTSGSYKLRLVFSRKDTKVLKARLTEFSFSGRFSWSSRGNGEKVGSSNEGEWEAHIDIWGVGCWLGLGFERLCVENTPKGWLLLVLWGEEGILFWGEIEGLYVSKSSVPDPETRLEDRKSRSSALGVQQACNYSESQHHLSLWSVLAFCHQMHSLIIFMQCYTP